MNDLKNVFLAGIGAAAATYEKADSMVKQFVEKGKLTVDEGKELSEELKRNFTSSASDKMNKLNNKIDDIKPATKDEVRQIIEQYGFCYKGEYDLLQSKVDELEKKVEELEKNLKTNN
ncbi:MAG: phasin family protein [Inconstantimicrobium porci]|uniref:Phasin family protein n=1 Tax=Inconstantimicrobium porci TaxID=2652291 RepID=A0A7X2MX82_9CLOT|nr:phasin family protein [Inconstantimicrobium porci]MDD6769436.1 phasin family protein [Inconstantimicrobium porci]MDY5911174.1 phasin family protein [Inconstantimicrobium porci]MSR90757.1 hypothetical protein [Inconstantimicrobium porci]